MSKRNTNIKDFFSKTKKNNDVIEPDTNKKTVADEFYEKCLIKQSEKKCSQFCIEKKCALQNEIKIMREKIKKTDTALDTCKRIIAEKDTEIKNMKKQVEKIKLMEFNKPSGKKEELSFSSFTDVFTSAQLSQLRSIPSEKKNDSTFIFEAVKILYQENFNLLSKKSVTGRGASKEPVSPKKMNILQDLYHERLDRLKLVNLEEQQRLKKLNLHIKSAINNIPKTDNNVEISRRFNLLSAVQEEEK